MRPATTDPIAQFWFSGGDIIQRHGPTGKPGWMTRHRADDLAGYYARLALEVADLGDLIAASHFATLALQLIRAMRAQDQWSRLSQKAA